MSRRLEKVIEIGLRHADLPRFLVVGTIGFCVDGGILWLLHHLLGWTPVEARCIGFPLALTVTWYLNRRWTFRHGRHRGPGRQYALYLAIQLTGLAINFSAFVLLTRYGPWFGRYPVAALAVASILALFFTFPTAKWIAFARPRSEAAGGRQG